MSDVQTAISIRTIKAEPLTAEAFAPFGQILTPQSRPRLPINSYGDRLDIYRETFESDQPVEWLIVQFWLRKLRVIYLERHMQITQAFIPLGGAAFLTVVARPDAREESGLPALDEIHAFIVPGSSAIQLYRGTWHENPIPLTDGQQVLVTGHQALTRGHQTNPDKNLEIYALDVEKRNVTERGGFELLIDLA